MGLSSELRSIRDKSHGEHFMPDCFRLVCLRSCAVLCCAVLSRSVMSDALQPHRLGPAKLLWARILEWVARPCSRESSQPRDRTQVSCIAGRFFTNWAIRETYIYITESLSWTAEIKHSIVNQLYVNKFFSNSHSLSLIKFRLKSYHINANSMWPDMMVLLS